MATDRSSFDTSSRSATLRSFAQEMKAARRAGWGNPWGYAFIAPALVLYLIFNVWPIIRGFLMAFTDYRFLYPDTRWDFHGLTNFIEMFSDDNFWEALVISLRYTITVVPIALSLALVLAIFIARTNRLSGFYRWIVYLPTILPIAVTLLMFKQFYSNKFGFINVNLRDLGWARPPDWLSSVKYALTAVGIADIWRGIGFPTILFLVGIYGINSELFEAASIDGATRWQQLWKITLPMLRPTITLVLVLNSSILGATEQMMMMTNGGPQNSTLTAGLYLYRLAFQQGDLRLGYASAVSLTLGLISSLITLFWFRMLREK